jgi:PadR family transcriptional regulator PadR
LIRSQWKISKKGRRRKYYKLTELGREELEKEKKQWMSVHKLLSKLWEPVPGLE